MEFRWRGLCASQAVLPRYVSHCTSSFAWPCTARSTQVQAQPWGPRWPSRARLRHARASQDSPHPQRSWCARGVCTDPESREQAWGGQGGQRAEERVCALPSERCPCRQTGSQVTSCALEQASSYVLEGCNVSDVPKEPVALQCPFGGIQPGQGALDGASPSQVPPAPWQFPGTALHLGPGLSPAPSPGRGKHLSLRAVSTPGPHGVHLQSPVRARWSQHALSGHLEPVAAQVASCPRCVEQKGPRLGLSGPLSVLPRPAHGPAVVPWASPVRLLGPPCSPQGAHTGGRWRPGTEVEARSRAGVV